MNTPARSEPGQEGASLATALRGCLGGAAVFIGATDQTITFSPEASILLGLPPHSPLALPWDTLPEPVRRLATETLNSGGTIFTRQIELPTGRKGTRTIEVSAFPVQRDGHAAGVVLILADLVSLRQCEERLQRLDRLANLGTLAAGMAHEIKNALVAGKTFIDLLLEKNPEAELTDVVRRELARIDAIVARLLKFARPAQASFNAVHVHELLDHALRLLQPQLENRRIALGRHFEAAPDLVTGDEGELVQAFMNLLLNAVEAMPPEGKLTIMTENTAARAGSGKLEELRITIADTGVGIPPENLPHLFDPFFTTKPSGTGLGLAVTKRIILEHHGELAVDSHLNQGTTFTLSLPAPKSRA